MPIFGNILVNQFVINAGFILFIFNLIFIFKRIGEIQINY